MLPLAQLLARAHALALLRAFNTPTSNKIWLRLTDEWETTLRRIHSGSPTICCDPGIGEGGITLALLRSARLINEATKDK